MSHGAGEKNVGPVIEALEGRVSSPKLTEPGPSRDQLEQILRCAVRAPDHGRLRPWRFVVVAGKGLNELGKLYEKAALAGDPELGDARCERLRRLPLRAPMIIVALTQVETGHKIPVIEQVVAVGVAVQNIQLAARALGYGAMWRTGEMASDPVVREHFGLQEKDEIVSFLYIGTTEGVPRDAEMPELSHCVSYWDH